MKQPFNFHTTIITTTQEESDVLDSVGWFDDGISLIDFTKYSYDVYGMWFDAEKGDVNVLAKNLSNAINSGITTIHSRYVNLTDGIILNTLQKYQDHINELVYYVSNLCAYSIDVFGIDDDGVLDKFLRSTEKLAFRGFGVYSNNTYSGIMLNDEGEANIYKRDKFLCIYYLDDNVRAIKDKIIELTK